MAYDPGLDDLEDENISEDDETAENAFTPADAEVPGGATTATLAPEAEDSEAPAEGSFTPAGTAPAVEATTETPAPAPTTPPARPERDRPDQGDPAQREAVERFFNEAQRNYSIQGYRDPQEYMAERGAFNRSDWGGGWLGDAMQRAGLDASRLPNASMFAQPAAEPAAAAGMAPTGGLLNARQEAGTGFLQADGTYGMGPNRAITTADGTVLPDTHIGAYQEWVQAGGRGDIGAFNQHLQALGAPPVTAGRTGPGDPMNNRQEPGTGFINGPRAAAGPTPGARGGAGVSGAVGGPAPAPAPVAAAPAAAPVPSSGIPGFGPTHPPGPGRGEFQPAGTVAPPLGAMPAPAPLAVADPMPLYEDTGTFTPASPYATEGPAGWLNNTAEALGNWWDDRWGR